MLSTYMQRLRAIFIYLSLVLILTRCGSGGIGGGSSDDDVQYAALGASDATGIGATPLTNGYVYLIKRGIENAGQSTNLMNYGVPDIESGGILDVEIKLLDLGNTPDIVTIFTGTNDVIAGASSARFGLDLAAILNHLRKIDGLEIYIADLPDITQLPRFKENSDPDVTMARVIEFNRIIREQAKFFNAQLVRLSDDAPNDDLISNDGLHPNDAGYARIAELFLQQILPRT